LTLALAQQSGPENEAQSIYRRADDRDFFEPKFAKAATCIVATLVECILLSLQNVCDSMHRAKHEIGYMIPVKIRTSTDFGALIRDRRRAIELNQAELATRIGVSRLWVNQVERGKPGASLALVLRALNAVGVEITAKTAGALDQALVGEPVFSHDINAIVANARRKI
jgi:HTH-type transcriptional regulator / antitoxin HipB